MVPRVLSNAATGVNSGLELILAEIAQSVILRSRKSHMDQNTVKLIAGILAVVLVAIIFLRRKKKKGAAEDEF
jgi:LPXTG-motif cell wall-anchored protein